jgi:hypothetical protein
MLITDKKGLEQASATPGTRAKRSTQNDFQ